MTIDEAIQYMKRKYDRIEILNGKTEEYHSQYDKEIIAWLEELKFLREWKENIMESLCKYDCNSIEEVAHNAYNKAINDALQVVEWDGYTLDIKTRIEQLGGNKE